jgi:glyceraldehyde 3-phosphate dehydrogenase
MKGRIAINGFGRIGRIVGRKILKDGSGLHLQAIMDYADPEQLAALAECDSNYGPSPEPSTFRNGKFEFGDRKVPYYRPDQVDYKEIGVDLVVEASGQARERRQAEAHLERGAARVLVTAPPKRKEEVDAILLYGVNHTEFDASKHQIVSNASCTTNCLVHQVKGLEQAGLEIRSAFFLTVHSVTNTQRLVDSPAAELGDAFTLVSGEHEGC